MFQCIRCRLDGALIGLGEGCSFQFSVIDCLLEQFHLFLRKLMNTVANFCLI